MKRLFSLILTVALLSVSFISCTERTYLQFEETTKSCDASAQNFTLTTTEPIDFLSIDTNLSEGTIKCTNLADGTLECKGDWYHITCTKNDKKISVSLSENNLRMDRIITINALGNGVVATCTVTQSKR